MQHGPRPLPLFLDMLRSETATSPARMAAALAGLRRYQEAPRPAQRPAAPVIATSGRASLRDHGGAGPVALFVPSLINPPTVLDLSERASLLRWLAASGVRPMLVDWGAPAPGDAALDIAGHVERLLPLIDAVGEEATLVGYCLGGTMALAAATLRPPRALVLLATPWRFSAYSADARETLLRLWRAIAPTADRLGLLPMEVLQACFWRLDPARTVAKFERLGARAPNDPAVDDFVALEDWANDGPPLPFAAARDLFEGMFRDDRTGRGAWRVGGRPIDPRALACPVLEVVSTVDRIVPAAGTPGVGRTLPLDLGHIGMIVGHRAPDHLWNPLRDWLLHPPW